MKKFLFSVTSFLYIISFFSWLPVIGQTEETKENSANGSFSFEVLFPENQQGEVGYYDLHMAPSQEQTVQIRLINTSDKEKKISLTLSGAKTNMGGVIEYTPYDLENDASLKFPFEEVVSAPKEIILPAHSEELVPVEIKMPATSFEGYIAGGIQIIDETQEMASDGMIVNRMAYMTAMLLSTQSKEAIQQIPEEMKLNSVKAGLANYSNSIFVDFSNIQPIYVGGMTVEVQISLKGKEEVLYEKKKSQMDMAPNSHIQFPVEMNGERMVPGNYQARIIVTTVKGGRWEWHEAFAISDKEADEFNSQDLSLVQEPGLNWQLIALIVAGALLLLLVIFITIHLIKKQRQRQRKTKIHQSKKQKKKTR